MEIKILLCNCKGTCPSFSHADMNTLPFAIESHLDVKYTVVHSQLCSPGGQKVLKDAVRSAGPFTYLIIGACAPETQRRAFRKMLRSTGFPEDHVTMLDIRELDNDRIVEKLRAAVENLAVPAAVD